MHPELNFVFNYYQKKYQRAITAFTNPTIQANVEPIQLPQFINSIYWRKWKHDQETKKEKEKKDKITTEELNSFVLGVTKNEIFLPKSGNLDEATFLYRNWKATDANNTNAKVIGIEENRGKNKYELMRRICALGNAGGGILIWGIN